jgi:hypothetical protein
MGNDIRATVVKDGEELYTVSVPKEAADLYNELKLNQDLYRRVMEDDPKRVVELVARLLK